MIVNGMIVNCYSEISEEKGVSNSTLLTVPVESKLENLVLVSLSVVVPLSTSHQNQV